MKIIHCLNHFFPEHIAGTEVYTLALAQELKKIDIGSVVLIPNYGKSITEEYFIEEIRVIKYAEPSVSDRALQMGKRKPEGINAFIKVLQAEKPAVVHFHELSTGAGLSIHHLVAAKENGCKVVMTFHLAGYSCRTGHLMYKDEVLCDGLINISRCTNCVYTVLKVPTVKRKLLHAAAMLSYRLNYDTTNWPSAAGTALGYPFIIKRMKSDLLQIAAFSDKLVTLVHWYKNVLELNGIAADKLSCIPQAVPRRMPVSGMMKSQPGVVKLVFIGRISRLKGIHLLISAISQLPQHLVTLNIYGTIADRDYAATCMTQSESLKNISWKGPVAPAEVIARIAEHDLLCLPSLSEMAPIVIQEAFAAGVPVLASDIYGNAEQLKEGGGWLFKFNDSDDLLLHLQKILKEPSLLESARNKIPAVRSFREVASQYASIYHSLDAKEVLNCQA